MKPKTPKIKISEKELQREILKVLKWFKDVYVVRNNNFAGRILRGNGTAGWISNISKGAPDIILCKNGLWLGLELKGSDGEMSKDQKKAEARIRQCGGHYFIVRNLDDLKVILENF